jgi:hypothetical protein
MKLLLSDYKCVVLFGVRLRSEEKQYLQGIVLIVSYGKHNCYVPWKTDLQKRENSKRDYEEGL